MEPQSIHLTSRDELNKILKGNLGANYNPYRNFFVQRGTIKVTRQPEGNMSKRHLN